MALRIIKEYPVLEGEVPYYKDPEGNILLFNDERHCKVFLTLNGYLPGDIDLCSFEPVEDPDDTAGVHK